MQEIVNILGGKTSFYLEGRNIEELVCTKPIRKWSKSTNYPLMCLIRSAASMILSWSTCFRRASQFCKKTNYIDHLRISCICSIAILFCTFYKSPANRCTPKPQNLPGWSNRSYYRLILKFAQIKSLLQAWPQKQDTNTSYVQHCIPPYTIVNSASPRPCFFLSSTPDWSLTIINLPHEYLYISRVINIQYINWIGALLSF